MSGPALSLVRPTTKSKPNRKREPAPGVVDAVRVSLRRGNRLATVIGMLWGGWIPFATYEVAHSLATLADWRVALVLGGLLYSATSVYQWSRKALDSWYKALGFVVLTEGLMVGGTGALPVAALVYLVVINAVSTGVTLQRGVRIE